MIRSAASRARGTWDHTREPAAISALQSWTAHAATDVALALAIARRSPADWAPEALLWQYARAEEHRDRIAHALALAVILAGGRAGILLTAERVGVAVMDAMARVRSRACVAAEQRCRELRIGKADFLLLRSTAEAALLRTLRSGLRAYRSACGNRSEAREPRAPIATPSCGHEHSQAA